MKDNSVVEWNFNTGQSIMIVPPFASSWDCELLAYSPDLDYAVYYPYDKYSVRNNDYSVRLFDLHSRTYTDLYNVDGVNVLNCDFTDIKASAKLKAILYQNNADIEPPPETPI